MGLVPDFRPEDTVNKGIGVLIQYHVKVIPEVTITQAGPSAGQFTADQIPTLDLISSIMEDLGYPPDMDNLGRGFFDYGMDSLELVRIRNKLSSTLDLELSATLLLDYPTVQDLATQLDKDRGIGQAKQDDVLMAPVMQEPEKLSWDNMPVVQALEMLDNIKKALGDSKLQQKFASFAQQCYPDMVRYTFMIERVVREVEGKVLHEFGLCENLEAETVKASRGEMTKYLATHWTEAELRARCTDIMHLTKQDQLWE